MNHALLRRRLVASLAGLAFVLAAPTAVQADGPGHTGIVSSVPSELTPNIHDGLVNTIHAAGSKIIVGGTFTSVSNRGSAENLTRRYLLAFNQATGQVDTAFAPVIDGEVRTILPGPTADTVYVAGAFNNVGAVKRRKIALLNVNTGAVVTTFKPPAFNSRINDMVKVGNNLLVGGPFTVVGGQPRLGLASLNATTGALTTYLTTSLTEHHNWAGTGAKSPVGPDKLAISPDGTQLVALGNFKMADGVLHDQIVKLDLGATSATIANWNTDRFSAACARNAFDAWVRDVQYSPDGSYFVVVTTGAAFTGTLCDSASRWEANATGTAVQPTWVNFTGADTLLSVGITEHAVYVGGHIRWVNNTLGRDNAAAGAVARPSIAALDPISGLPLSWNPGRRPRSYGVTELYATSDGLWLGYDSDFMGNYQWRRERIAFMPLTGGYSPHPTNVASLPGKVYVGGQGVGTGIAARTFTGAAGGAGPLAPVTDTVNWSTARGGFWVGGSLFYGTGNTLMRRTFDGTTFGEPVAVNPYSDPYWDTVPTDSSKTTGQTYKGVPSNFYAEIPNVTGMFYSGGKLFYSLTNQQSLYWRWFQPESGVVGADKFTVAGTSAFNDAGGIFLSGTTLYQVNRNTGTLSARAWNNGVPGTGAVISGPQVDGQDWRGRAVFVAP